MIDRGHALPVSKQCAALGISRGGIYYKPVAVSASDLTLMRRLDELHLEHPHAGSRMLRDLLAAEGSKIGRRHVRTLMQRMGIEAVYRRPRTSIPAPGHKIFPYLLRELTIDRANQVWEHFGPDCQPPSPIVLASGILAPSWLSASRSDVDEGTEYQLTGDPVNAL
jgi:putative transposase